LSVYSVKLTPTAESELRSAFQYIHARAPRNAARWLRGIWRAIDSLEKFPTRCGIAREHEHLGHTLRHYIFKSHRIIFFVDEDRKLVSILYIRHSKMRAVGEAANDDE
jgi:plasmid stabilization system protein ParE